MDCCAKCSKNCMNCVASRAVRLLSLPVQKGIVKVKSYSETPSIRAGALGKKRPANGCRLPHRTKGGIVSALKTCGLQNLVGHYFSAEKLRYYVSSISTAWKCGGKDWRPKFVEQIRLPRRKEVGWVQLQRSRLVCSLNKQDRPILIARLCLAFGLSLDFHSRHVRLNLMRSKNVFVRFYLDGNEDHLFNDFHVEQTGRARLLQSCIGTGGMRSKPNNSPR